MTELEKFEAHIKDAAWYRVLSEAAKDDDDGASIFRMARMAASEAWQASRRAALEEANQTLLKRGLFGAAELVRALSTGDTNNG